MTSISVNESYTHVVVENDTRIVVVEEETGVVIQLTGVGPQGPKGDPGDLGAGTDLSVGTRTATTLIIASSTGADVTVPAATQALSGLMEAADKLKLDDIDSDITALAIALS